MSVSGKYFAAAVTPLSFISPAYAQAPQTEKNVSMKMVLMIMDGTLEQCSKDGYKVSVVIVDKAGNVAGSVRGDGTNPHTMEFARLKAYTARTRGQTSLEVMKLMEKPENSWIKQIPNVVGIGGGVPIKAGNEVIGAVGVSGAPAGEKDEVCRHRQGGRQPQVNASGQGTCGVAARRNSRQRLVFCSTGTRQTGPADADQRHD
ncbi:MAG TPA: heme-binding protein [Beijerinckiaceae bacterium]|nr:heme-binding protein [Beijerinckiaceae bacterium]